MVISVLLMWGVQEVVNSLISVLGFGYCSAVAVCGVKYVLILRWILMVSGFLRGLRLARQGLVK